MLLRWSRLILLTVVFCHADDLPNNVSNAGSFDPMVIQVRGPETADGISKPDKKNAVHNISIVGDQFMLDGQALHIISGSLHYFRLPAVYWRDRLRKLKAAGLNAVSTYVEWSYHEPEERQYLFAGDQDIAQFVRIAAEEGLHVLLRPGPYICAERDLGGFPYWLLGKYKDIKLRSTDKNFMEETKIWFAKLFEQITPLLFGNGGPIILVQVENEYGSYASDKTYMGQVRDLLKGHVGTNAILYTTDGASTYYFLRGSVPDTLTTIDFGVGYDAKQTFEPLRSFMPSGPLMNSEFYPGWLTHWGETLQQINKDHVVNSLRNMIDNKINVNFYMFFGGTNFEFTSGANYASEYQPDITSYDYDAPLSEAGDPTPKYYAIRDALKNYSLVDTSIDPPVPAPKGAYGEVKVSRKISLLSTEGRSALGKAYNSTTGSTLPTFEQLRQKAGLVLYETKLNGDNGTLNIGAPRDRIQVFVDGVKKGVITRIHKSYNLNLTSKPDSVLSLLVENQGRINFGSRLHDYKGILSNVKYNNNILSGKWSITGFNLENLQTSAIPQDTAETEGPTLYEGYLTLPLDQEPLDTFLDTTGWGKGYIWINGYNLGRYWPVKGPQITLYVPGAWLKKAPETNHLQIVELDEAFPELTVQFIDYPILNRTNPSGTMWK